MRYSPWVFSLILAAVVAASACKSDSSDNGEVLSAGAVTSLLPDARIFVLDSSDSTLRTIDGNAPTQAGVSSAIDFGGVGVGGMALDAFGDRLWVSLPSLNVVWVLDAKTMQRLATVNVGTTPGAIAIDDENSRVFVLNTGGANVSVFSSEPPYTQDPASPLSTGTTPVDLAVVNGSSLVIANQGSNDITVYSTSSLSAVSGSPFSVGTAPVDVEAAGTSVFVLNQTTGSISRYNAEAGAVTTAVTGLSTPVQLGYHRYRDLLLVAEQGGTLRVFSSLASDSYAEKSGSPVTVGGTLAGISVNSFLDRAFISVSSTGLVHVHRVDEAYTEIDSNQRLTVGTSPSTCWEIEPELLTTWDNPAGGTVKASWLHGDTVYLAAGDLGLVTMDASNLKASFATAGRTTMSFPDTVQDLLVYGNYLYVANDEEGLQVLEIAHDPFSPTPVRTVNALGIVVALFRIGDYIITESGGMSVVDITDPLLAIETDSDTTGDTGGDVQVSDGVGYTGNGTDLSINRYGLDRLPQMSDGGTFAAPFQVLDVAGLPGNIAVVAAGSAGLAFIDTGGVSDLPVLAVLPIEGEANSVQAAGRRLYVIDGKGRIQFVDARDPEHPRVLGNFDPGVSPLQVREFGNKLFVADGSDGLKIYRFFP